MKPRFYLFEFIFTGLLLLNAYAFAATSNQIRCANNLASPISNFCEVKPGLLWRGAKPNETEAAWLVKNGVKTIINLELLFDDLDELQQAKLPDYGRYQLDYYRVKTWEPLYAFAQSVADDDVIHFLAIARQAKHPIYVHCRAGENRTGVMIAAYKIILDNQTSAEQIAAVLREMQSYEGFWTEATTEYIKNLSLRHAEIRRKVETYPVEASTQITYENGKMTDDRLD